MGRVELTTLELEEMLNRAAQNGARAALKEIGLHEESAAEDIKEVRELLSAWRETKKAAWVTIVKIVTGAILVFISTAVWLAIKDNAK